MISARLEFGDICLVNFEPSVGSEYKKTRPAIIIQEAEHFDSSPCVTVMPISSKLQRRLPEDIFVGKDEKNRLAQNSTIKVFHICTFDKKRFIHYIGRANSPVIRQVRGHLRRHFGL